MRYNYFGDSMKKQKKLLFARSIFVLIIIILFGTIIITEKAGGILIPKAEKKFNEYLEKNYKKEKNNFIIGKITYKNTTYKVKVMNKLNKNHYFYIKYYHKKITDTYKDDYVKGNSILSYTKKKLKKEIEEKTTTSCNIEIPNTLDKYTTTVQNRIINNDNLLELKFYNIKKEILIKEWNSKEIIKRIDKTINVYKENNITPKNYIIIITNKDDITESIEIKLTEDFIDNNNKEKIIDDIIDDNNSKILKENKITYKYLN